MVYLRETIQNRVPDRRDLSLREHNGHRRASVSVMFLLPPQLASRQKTASRQHLVLNGFSRQIAGEKTRDGTTLADQRGCQRRGRSVWANSIGKQMCRTRRLNISTWIPYTPRPL